MQLEIILAGFLVGAIVGLTGVGAGPLLTPMMILVFGIRPSMAIGTGIAAMGLTKLIGGIKHVRQGTVNSQVTRFLCLGGIPGSIVGSSFTALLMRLRPAEVDRFLTNLLAVALIVIAFLIYFQALAGKKWNTDYTRGEWMGHRRKPFTIAVGFVAGAMMGATSIGSGTLVVTMFALLYPLPSSSIVGSVVLYGAVVTILAGLLQASMGNVDVPLLLNLLLGSLPGVYLGSALCGHLPEKILRPALATLILAAGLKMV